MEDEGLIKQILNYEQKAIWNWEDIKEIDRSNIISEF
jgi:hypothetical protein